MLWGGGKFFLWAFYALLLGVGDYKIFFELLWVRSSLGFMGFRRPELFSFPSLRSSLSSSSVIVKDSEVGT